MRIFSAVPLLFALTLTLLLFGCTRSGSEYLGKWQDTAHPNAGTLEIARNGDNYLVTMTSPSAFGGKPQSQTTSATAKDGVLEIGSGFGSMKLTYVKNTDGLLVSSFGGSGEMKRVK